MYAYVSTTVDVLPVFGTIVGVLPVFRGVLEGLEAVVGMLVVVVVVGGTVVVNGSIRNKLNSTSRNWLAESKDDKC